MSNKNNMLLNSLWFLVGMAAIAAIPLLLLEQCSEARKPGDQGEPGPETGFSRSSHREASRLRETDNCLPCTVTIILDPGRKEGSRQ